MNSGSETSHFFPCSGKIDNDSGYGVQGVFELYKHCIKHIELSGPTYFAPMLQNIVQTVQSEYLNSPNSYFIFMILTDGAIYDMPATKDWIVEGSELPLSIIIIGVGAADFGLMEELDSDDKAGSSKRKVLRGTRKTARRDIVQFVPFNQYSGRPEELAACVLHELPDQVTSFYRMVGRKPLLPEDVAKDEFGMSEYYTGASHGLPTNAVSNLISAYMNYPKPPEAASPGNQTKPNK